MNRFEHLIKSVSAKPSVIMHLGAGTCSGYELYKALGAEQIIFVEPDPYLAEAAIDVFSNTSHVKVIQRAIAAKKGRQTLNITNNRRFSSLLKPNGLFDFYPNVVVEDQAKVKAITLTKLCQKEKVNKDFANLLIAELNGLENEIFPTVNIDALQCFKWIIIRSSETSLYTPVTANTQRSLSEVMQDAGFMVLTFEEDAPPFLNILCIRNDAAIDNNQLKAQEGGLLNTISILEQNLSKQIAELGDLQTSHAATMAKLQLSLNSSSDELATTQARIQSITAEKGNQQQQIKELSSTVEAKSAELDTAQAIIQSNTAEKDNQQQQIKELSSTVEAKSAELDTAQTIIQSNTAEKDNQQQQIKELSSTVEAKSAELDTAQAIIQSNTAEKDNQQQQIKELSSTVEAKSAELDTAQALIHSITAEKDNLQEQLTTLTDALKEKEKEISEMQQTVRINNKLILKSDTDLRDLQLQYRTALQHQEQQHTLLGELKEKLREASEYYRKLNLQNLVIDSDMLEQNDSNNK